MREEEVPQDDSFYAGHLRACYAVNKEGKYVIATSRGWEAERIATAEALADLEAKIEAVRQRVLDGALSPLAYHMAVSQMTPRLLAQNARMWTWRVKRHLIPRVFARLGEATLGRYASCLNITTGALVKTPGSRWRFSAPDQP